MGLSGMGMGAEVKGTWQCLEVTGGQGRFEAVSETNH